MELLETDFQEFQLLLLDGDGRLAATNNSAPLAWDGTDRGLPDGWDRQFEQSAADLERGAAVNTLGALQIVVDPERRGAGLSGVMVNAVRANARAHGCGHVIACVRPTDKHLYPLTPIERYTFWPARTASHSTHGSGCTSAWEAGSSAPRPARWRSAAPSGSGSSGRA